MNGTIRELVPRTATHRWLVAAAAVAVGVALASCTTMGTGQGSARSGGAPVAFSWLSKDGGTTGTMTATLPDGTVVSGPFVQLTSAVQIDTLEPMWRGWRRGWGDWRYWGSYPVTAFATQYSGKVVANLQWPGDHRLRCRFHLNSPRDGMLGGGQGECQLGNGETIDAVFQRP